LRSIVRTGSLAVAGLTDWEIAEVLFLGPHTASKYDGNFLAKLDAASCGEAVVFAVRPGFISQVVGH
jgi:DNA-binding CsgD family transcriptional regulator